MSRLERRHGAYPGEGTEETRVERESGRREGGREGEKAAVGKDDKWGEH